MLAALRDDLEAAAAGEARELGALVHQLRGEVGRKPTREDVLRLLAKGIKDVSERLRPQDDSLMVGRAPVRCISCNKVTNMHRKTASKVVHAGLPPVSATLAPGSGNESLKSLVDSHHSVVIQASYATGRAGALRPLQRSAAPGVPVGSTSR